MTDIVKAQVGDLLIPMDAQNLSTTEVKVAYGYVVIDEQESSLFIDYKNGALFTFSKRNDICQQFNILNPNQGDSFTLGKIDIYGEVKFLEVGGFQNDIDRRYYRMKVLYAPRAMMLRGVRPTRFEQFGMTFYPEIVDYVVDRNHVNFDLFVQVAEYNAAMGEFNPLILKLDLTHIFSRLGGVPVKQKDKDAARVLSFVIEEEKALREILPQQCSSL